MQSRADTRAPFTSFFIEPLLHESLEQSLPVDAGKRVPRLLDVSDAPGPFADCYPFECERTYCSGHPQWCAKRVLASVCAVYAAKGPVPGPVKPVSIRTDHRIAVQGTNVHTHTHANPHSVGRGPGWPVSGFGWRARAETGFAFPWEVKSWGGRGPGNDWRIHEGFILIYHLLTVAPLLGKRNEWPFGDEKIFVTVRSLVLVGNKPVWTLSWAGVRLGATVWREKKTSQTWARL